MIAASILTVAAVLLGAGVLIYAWWDQRQTPKW
jgi:hypothetical protein